MALGFGEGKNPNGGPESQAPAPASPKGGDAKYDPLVSRREILRLWGPEIVALSCAVGATWSFGLWMLLARPTLLTEPVAAAVPLLFLLVGGFALMGLRAYPGILASSRVPVALDRNGLTVFPRRFYAIGRLQKMIVLERDGGFAFELLNERGGNEPPKAIFIGARWVKDPDLFVAVARQLLDVDYVKNGAALKERGIQRWELSRE